MNATQPEQWRPVAGYEGHYEVSDQGRVRSFKRGGLRILRQSPTGKEGYLAVGLHLNGVQTTRNVHTLVAETWHGTRPLGMEARHLDGDHLNNTAVNVQWATHSVNVLDQVIQGTNRNSRKTHCPANHEYTEANTRLYRGLRYCKKCRQR